MGDKDVNAGKTILVDFDCVLHKYSKGYADGSIYDGPVEGAIAAIKKLQDAGYHVRCCTSRNDTLPAVQEWLDKHGINIEASNKKVPCIAFIDDRGIRFTNWPDVLRYFT